MAEITPELVLSAYAAGMFPMAQDASDPDIFWLDPDHRGVIPLDDFHISRSLAKAVRRDQFEVVTDQDFDAVIDKCAESTDDRQATWINSTIRNLFSNLFDIGVAHTVECRSDGELVGGLYGVALGGAFFGESMFSRRTDASKVALVHLVARLKAGGFTLLDTQFITPHLETFGAEEISRRQYQKRLAKALEHQGDWFALPSSMSGAAALQSITQTS